jgi:hypothetical protein
VGTYAAAQVHNDRDPSLKQHQDVIQCQPFHIALQKTGLRSQSGRPLRAPGATSWLPAAVKLSCACTPKARTHALGTMLTCECSPRRREQLPLTCRAFAAACDDIIWDSVRVDARQYKRQTWTAMTWERVEPWLAKRAGNICGIDLRCTSPSASCCKCVMYAGQTMPWLVSVHNAVPSVSSAACSV